MTVEDPTLITILAADLADIRELTLALNPALANPSGLPLAIALRDMMHNHITFPQDRKDSERITQFDFTALADTYRISLLDPRAAHACGGRVIQYLAALNAFGFTARLIALYSGNEKLDRDFPSHASADVMIDGKWTALDPYFNLSFHNEAGSYLSWTDIVERAQNGWPIDRSTDGYKPHISLDEYLQDVGKTMKDMTSFVVIGPSGASPARAFPGTWDGVLHYNNGSTFDALTSAGSRPYSDLASVID